MTITQESVKILAEEYSVKDDIDTDSGELKGIFLEGKAITFEKPTRNRVSYTYQSGVETHQTLWGKPFLDTHDDSSIREKPPFGHVCSPNNENDLGKEGSWLAQDDKGRPCLFYRVNLDAAEEVFIRKLRRRDIPGVSIQVLVDDIVQMEDNEGEYIQANIKEFLELSAVLIPGDGDTTMALAEKFKGKTIKNSLEKPGIKKKDGTGPLKCGEADIIGKKIGDTPDEEPEEIKSVRPIVGVGNNEKIYEPKEDEEDEKKGNKVLYSNNETFNSGVMKHKISESAYYGCKCPDCNAQMIKDNFSVPSIKYESFQLRCSECQKIIAKDEKLFNEYLKKAKIRMEES